MAYRLKASEPVSESVRRIATEEIKQALEQLKGRSGHDEAIHEARKSLKKLRGLLRLVQFELGNVYQAENSRLGNIGRKLSELRDAKATVEIFDGLMEAHKDQLQKRAFGSIRQALERAKQDTEHKLDVHKVLRGTVTALTAAGKRVEKWPIGHDGFAAFEAGFKDRYRAGRKAMAEAIDDPSPENYHQWRKRVKDHWYHVRLLEDLWKLTSPARESDLHNLEAWLGDDHNLAVLRVRIEANPGDFGNAETVEVFLGLLDERQKQLRHDSLTLGARIYREKSGQLTRQLEKLWKGRAKTASAA